MTHQNNTGRRQGLGRGWVLLSLLFLLALSGCEEKKKTLSIKSISPDRGQFSGGTTVVIEGSGFQQGAKGINVYFGKRHRARNVTIHSDSKIMVDAPGGEIGETVDVEVIFDDARSATLSKAFTYFDPSPATMDDLVKGVAD